MDSELQSSIVDSEINGKLNTAIHQIGQPDFPAALVDLIGSYCPFNSSLLMLYSGQRRPDVLVDGLLHALRENSVDHYLAGSYLLDPFYIRSRQTRTPQLLRMRDIAPRDFDTSEYFVSYYKQSNVADELNYLVPIDDRRVVAISVGRSTLHEPFSESEIETCTVWLQTIAALVTRHFALPGVELPSNDEDDEHQRLESILHNFGSDVLTPRECQVVQRMLNGHSASSIAELLSVSIETIRVHRRNIYEKLHISSLAELFALALKAIYSRASID